MLGAFGQHQHFSALPVGALDLKSNRVGSDLVVRQVAQNILDARRRRHVDACLAVAWRDFQIVRCARRPDCRVAQRSTLHEDDGLLPVAADGRGGQPMNKPGLDPLEYGVKAQGPDMVAFVNNHLAVVRHQRIDFAFSGQRLHHSNVDAASGLGCAALNDADHLPAHAQKGLQALLPLLEQLRAVHQNQGVDAPAGNEIGGHDRLAESRRRAQHPGVIGQQACDRSLLVQAQGSLEADIKDLTLTARIVQRARYAVFQEQRLRSLQTATGQGNVLGIILRAANDAGLVPHRHAHGLRLVELGVLERSQANEPVSQGLGQRGFFKINLIGHRHHQGRRHFPEQFARSGNCRQPGSRQVLVVHKGHVERVRPACRPQNGGLDILGLHLLDGCQKRPLVGIGVERFIDKDAAAILARLLLQRRLGCQIHPRAWYQGS